MKQVVIFLCALISALPISHITAAQRVQAQQDKAARIRFQEEVRKLMEIDNVIIKGEQSPYELERFAHAFQKACKENPQMSNEQIVEFIQKKMPWKNDAYKFYFARGSKGATLRGIAVKWFHLSMQDIPAAIEEEASLPVQKQSQKYRWLKPLCVVTTGAIIMGVLYAHLKGINIKTKIHHLWHMQR